MNKKIFISLLAILPLLNGCGNEVVDQVTRTKLILTPNEKYFIQNNTSDGLNDSKTLKLKQDAPNAIDYSFKISKTEVDNLNLINPNDLIIGRDRILLQPVAVNYVVVDDVVTDEEASRMTPEQTETNFTPIIEMSGSGYGNANISLDQYDTPQLRTCYAISNQQGVIQSEYYDVSIIIEDSIGPSAPTDILNVQPMISYKNQVEGEGFFLNNDILINYTDNDSQTTLSVKYFLDDTYLTEISGEEVIENLRNSSSLIVDNKIQSLPVYYKVYDDNGNASNNGLAYVKLFDDVKPYLVDLNNQNVTSFNFGEKAYYPDVEKDLKEYIKSNFKVIDEVDGELNIDNSTINITSNGASLTIYDKSGNKLYLFDETSKLTNDYLEDSYYIWYPEGSNEETNPERGLQYTFVLNKETNEYEIEILGPNLAKGQYKKDWLGTNGEGHIQIPQTIEFYGHEYKVSVIGEEAFNNVPIKSLSTEATGQDGVVDFSNTYVREFKRYAFRNSGNTTNFWILRSLASNIDMGGGPAIVEVYNTSAKVFISTNVSKIYFGAVFAKNLYLEFSQEEQTKRENSGDYSVSYDENGELDNAWYPVIGTNFFYNYTLDQFKSEFGIN